ncbi:MAG: hypothetical protein QCI82_06390 [Candidatus Thermoplasmatota archaeon]|nr:hypothetical protein [Candidatus Thermoplasmatota archaeon]
MRKAAIAASILLASILLLSGSANANDPMGGRGSDEGMRQNGTPGGPSGSPHPWGAMEGGRNIGNEMMFRYSRNGPDIGITDKDGKGITMRISDVGLSGDDGYYLIDIAERNWTYSELDDENGGAIGRYDLSSSWRPGNSTVNISLEFELEWTHEGGQLRYRLNIEGIPDDGMLTIRSTYRLESFDEWGPGFKAEGRGVRIIGEREDDLGRIESAGRMRYRSSNSWEEAPAEITITPSDDETSVNTSATLEKGADSISTEATITLFESFVNELSHVIDGGISYVRDHIASFLIGLGSAMMVVVVSLALLSRIRVDGSEGVVLEKNRYYRSVKGRSR